MLGVGGEDADNDALLDACPVERETANAQLDWQVRCPGYCQRSHRWMLDATSIDAAGIGSVCICIRALPFHLGFFF